MLKTLFIDIAGNFHDYGSEVSENFTGSVFPHKGGEQYIPIGTVNGRMIYRGVTDEEFKELTAGMHFTGVTGTPDPDGPKPTATKPTAKNPHEFLGAPL
jgi:hypothetical protein